MYMSSQHLITISLFKIKKLLSTTLLSPVICLSIDFVHIYNIWYTLYVFIVYVGSQYTKALIILFTLTCVCHC